MSSPIFSLEIFPPKRSSSVGTLYDTLDGLHEIHPDFISVTYGTGKTADRTATARIARTIHQEYGVRCVGHLTARFLDSDQARQTLDDFVQAGALGVLALQGDPVEGRADANVFKHASDLATFIRQEYPGLRIFGACYPQGHPDAPSYGVDVQYLRYKVDSGVTHLISQLFFDNDDFMRFLDDARAVGIDVPIEAGIMPVFQATQIRRMTALCGASIPAKIERLLQRWGDDQLSLRQAGIAYASEQISDLVSQGVDGIHLYTMNRPVLTRKIWSNVSALFGASCEHRSSQFV